MSIAATCICGKSISGYCGDQPECFFAAALPSSKGEQRITDLHDLGTNAYDSTSTHHKGEQTQGEGFWTKEQARTMLEANQRVFEELRSELTAAKERIEELEAEIREKDSLIQILKGE